MLNWTKLVSENQDINDVRPYNDCECSRYSEHWHHWKYVAWCIDELRYEAERFDQTGTISTYYGDVVKSAIAIPLFLRHTLRSAARPLEKCHDHRLRVDDNALDLVDPSLFPLVYEWSRILKNDKVCLEDCHFATWRWLPHLWLKSANKNARSELVWIAYQNCSSEHSESESSELSSSERMSEFWLSKRSQNSSSVLASTSLAFFRTVLMSMSRSIRSRKNTHDWLKTRVIHFASVDFAPSRSGRSDSSSGIETKVAGVDRHRLWSGRHPCRCTLSWMSYSSQTGWSELVPRAISNVLPS